MNNRIMILTDSSEHSQAIQDFIDDSRDSNVAVIDTTSGFMRHKNKEVDDIIIGNSRFERFDNNLDSYILDDIIDRTFDNIIVSYVMNYLFSIKNIEDKSDMPEYIETIEKFLLKHTNIENDTFDRYYMSDIIKYRDMNHAVYSIGTILEENFEHSRYIKIDEEAVIYSFPSKDALLIGDYIFIKHSFTIKKELLYLFKMIDINRIIDYVKEKTNIPDILAELQKAILTIIRQIMTYSYPNIDLYFNEIELKFPISKYANYLNEKYHNGSEVFYDGILSCNIDLSLVKEYDIDNIFTFEINKKKSYSKENGYIIDFPQLDCKLFSTVYDNKNKLLIAEYLEKVENYCTTLHKIINKEIIPTVDPDINHFSFIGENDIYINRNYMKGRLIYDTDKEKAGVIDEIVIFKVDRKINEIFINVKNIIPKIEGQEDEELWRLNNNNGRIYRNYSILNGDLSEAYDFINNYITKFEILADKIREIGDLRDKISKLQEEAEDIERSLILN